MVFCVYVRNVLRFCRRIEDETSFARSQRPLGSHWIDCMFVSTCLALAAVTAWIGAVHTYRFGHDIVLMLDGAWRVLNGQRPSVDFSSSGWGPLPFLLYAGGLRLADLGVQGIGYAHAILGFTVGMWSYRIALKRMHRLLAALTSISLVLLVVSPYPIGFDCHWLSHAMGYNRQGYALLSVILLEALQDLPESQPYEWFVGGLSTGIACTMLLFLKANFGLVAVCITGLSLFLFGPVRTRVAGIVIGAALVTVPLLVYLSFDVPAIWRDVSVAAAARSASVGRYVLIRNSCDHLHEALPLFFLAVLLSWQRFRCGASRPVALLPVLFAVIVIGAGVLLLSTNAQIDGFPLSAVLAMIFATEVWRMHPSAEPYQFALIALALAVFLPQFLNDGTGVLLGAVHTRRNPPANIVTRFDSPVLRKLLLFDIEDPHDWERRSNGNAYVATLNEGLDLVRRNSNPNETVRDLDAFDPFAYALQRPPARGGAVALSFGNSFDDAHKRPADWLYGSADVILLPLYPLTPLLTHAALLRNYEAPALAGLTLCAESPHWKLYKRRPSLPGLER